MESHSRKGSVGGSRGQPTLEVAVCAVRRIREENAYEPCHYEVCIVREGIGERCALPNSLVEPGEHPERLALHELTAQTQLRAVQLIPMHIQSQPYRANHCITTFYLAPVARHDAIHGYPSVETRFVNLQFVVDNEDGEFDMIFGHRDMILAVDSWLRDQHQLEKTCGQLDGIFTQNSNDLRQGLGSVRFTLEDNPLFQGGIQPEEDKVKLGFNNPLFVSFAKENH